MNELDQLLADAESLPIAGWDFTVLGGRWQRGEPPWDLRAIVTAHLEPASTLLDLGTGGGEFLMSLSPLPSMVVATEGYPPNLEVARARLNPLGVRVLPIREDQHIDLAERSVDLVLARHEAFDAAEVARVLRPGGTFVTQQIGPRNYESLDRWFGVASEPAHNHLGSLSEFGQEIAAAGLEVRTLREASWSEAFLDVGAVVYFLRAAPWEVPGFSVARFRPVLEGIHRMIQQHGRWSLEAHRFLAVARRPGGPEATVS